MNSFNFEQPVMNAPVSEMGAFTVEVSKYINTPQKNSIKSTTYVEKQINTCILSEISLSTNLPDTIFGHQVVVTNAYVYIIGGYNSTGVTVNTWYATIDTNGVIGTWMQGSSLPSAMAYAQAIVTSTNVYLLGGYNGTSAVATTFTATITNGVIGTWSLSNNIIGASNNTYLSQVAVIGTSIYLFCGNNGGAIQTIWTATITNGIIGTWSSYGNYNQVIYGHSVAVIGTNIYMFGGNSNGILSTVYSAPITGNTFGSWTQITSLPGPLQYAQVVTTANRIYLIGGSNGTVLNIVYTAPIVNGVIGIWTIGPSLPIPLNHTQVIITSSRLILIGGHNGNTGVNTCFSAKFIGGTNFYSYTPMLAWKQQYTTNTQQSNPITFYTGDLNNIAFANSTSKTSIVSSWFKELPVQYKQSIVGIGSEISILVKARITEVNQLNIKTSIITVEVLTGQYNIILDVGFDEIQSVSNLYGLRINYNKKLIEGIVGFQTQKTITVACKNIIYTVIIKPSMVERLL